MRIEKPNRTGKLGSKVGSSKSSGDGAVFKPDMGQAAQRASASGSSAPITPVDAILALQGVEDPMFAKRKVARRGQSMLDALEEMKLDMLAGRVNEGRLNKLLALVQQAKSKSDPELDRLIEDIELRARVELAKLGHYPS